MVKTRASKALNALLPAYVNGTLDPLQKRLVEVWLGRNEEARKEVARIQALHDTLHNQAQLSPSPKLLQQILVQARSRRSVQRRSTRQSWTVWITAAIMVALAAILFVRVLPPGIVLEWTLAGPSPSAFRVYRAPAENENNLSAAEYELVSEIPADTTSRFYSFTDILLLSGQNYAYRVEALDQNGLATNSQTIITNASRAIIGQIALLLTSAVMIFLLWQLVSEQLTSRRKVGWV